MTILRYAALMGHPPVAKLLLQQDHSPVGAIDIAGDAPLHSTVTGVMIEVENLLFERFLVCYRP